MEQITEISIKEISLSGFRNQKEPVSFALGDVNCVTGHNGTGKTTLAHAVAFAFYGVTYFGEQKADRLINSESAGCEVKIDFTDQNGVLHSLIRRRFGSKTELIFDSYTVRQEEINRFICDKDTFLCILNPFYLTSFSEVKGRELLFRNLKTVGSEQIISAMSDGFKKPLEGLNITEPAEIIVEIFKFIEPSHVIGIGQRIISLPLPPYRVRREVLTHEVYAVYILPLGDTLQFLRRYVPTATGESFG